VTLASHFIDVAGLVMRYPHAEVNAVDQLDLQIQQGEIFGLLGPNGAGKTTTISILCGLLSPTAGKVTIDGLSMQNHPDQIKQMMGVVPQEMALFDKLTARENLMYFGHMYGLSGKRLKERTDNYLERFGLKDRMNHRIGSFSGGMKRRINLIAGILHQPKILFLDEPTVGIDVHSRHVILEFLSEINRQGTTILYTSHHLNEAENLCTRIGIIDYGKLIIAGQPKELIGQHAGCESLEDLFLHLTGRKLRD